MSKQQVCIILRDFNEDINAMIAVDDIDVYDLLHRCSRLEGQPKAKLTKKRRDDAEKCAISCVNELDNTYGDPAGSNNKTALMIGIEKIKQDKQREFERDAIWNQMYGEEEEMLERLNRLKAVYQF